MSVLTRILDQNDKNDIALFCIECKRLGYKNNESLIKMKYESATWFGTFKNELLISISGVRHEPSISNDAYRLLFRGCTLPGYIRKISKNIEEASYNWQHINHQIKYVKEITNKCSFYMTSNVEGGAKSFRLSKYMHKCKSVEYCGIMRLFNVDQKIWKWKE